MRHQPAFFSLLAVSRFMAVLCVAALLMQPAPSKARVQGILFDAETNHILKSYANPLIRAAGLPTEAIDVFLQASDQLNAFAVPGQIVLFSGLIIETETPEELEGVIAHEIAHVVGGHTATITDQAGKAGLVTLASVILGFGAIIAGLGPLGPLVLAGGTSIGAYSTIGEIRVLEASADQAALTYLERAGVSGRGLISFFEREFAPRERAFAYAARRKLSPYARTHPLTADRMKMLEHRVPQSLYYQAKTSDEKQLAHDMMRAKLFAFIRPPVATREKYPQTDQSLPARYARAIMLAYHQPNVSEALRLTDELIRDRPNYPYFRELKGYMLTKAARLSEAARVYEKAIALTPDNAIMRLEIGAILVNSAKPELVRKGINHLKFAAAKPNFSQYVHRHLARGYGATGQIGLAELATAEAFSSEQRIAPAVKHAQRALKLIPKKDHVNRLRAQDILAAANLKEAKKETTKEAKKEKEKADRKRKREEEVRRQ